MELKKLVEKCIDALNEEAGQDYEYFEDNKPFVAKVDTNDGFIELFYEKGDVDVEVFHDYEDVSHPRYGVRSVNLEAFLAKELYDCVDWVAVENEWRENSMDEYQRHGFASEADFWRWKEGR